MGRGSRRTVLIVLMAVVLATAALIFMRSLQGAEGSWTESNFVAAALEPILRRVYRAVGWVSAHLGHPMTIGYEAFVRKLAHLLEYALLGVECVAFTVALTKRVVSPYLWADLFIVLMVAVVDEYVQSFVGRTSLVADVLLDFSGGLAGMIVALIVAAIVRKLPSQSLR